jgi:hypothetical protein
VNPVLWPGFAYHHLVVPTASAAASVCGGWSGLGVVSEPLGWLADGSGGAPIGTDFNWQQPLCGRARTRRSAFSAVPPRSGRKRTRPWAGMHTTVGEDVHDRGIVSVCQPWHPRAWPFAVHTDHIGHTTPLA